MHALSKTKGKENRIIGVCLEETSSEVNLRFSDSGCGIEAGSESSIFEPTYSTRRDLKGKVVGTGMGLSIVKTFVEDHTDGRIKVESPGKYGGAEFKISIPRSDIRKGKSK